MRASRRSGAWVVVIAAAVAASCGGDDSDAGGDTSAVETTETGSREPVMRVTVDIKDEAVWNDGSPVTAADVICTYQASLNTPGSILNAGFDKVVDMSAGITDKQVIMEFSDTYAPYKGLFSNGFLQAAAVDDCNDVSADLQTELPFSARQWVIESFSDNEMVLTKNPNYFGDNAAKAERVVIVGYETTSTQINALKAAEVDFIYPQFYAGIQDALEDPNVDVSLNWGGDYEGFFLQVHDGPFADPVFRDAFVMSIDRQALFDQIYAPLAPGRGVLQCGPMVPGPYCEDAWARWTYDPEGAAALLEANGWKRSADGMWQKDGVVPNVRWMVDSGNARREDAQSFLIPRLAELGFDVRSDNCEALPCVFEQRLPSLDYDMAMYIGAAPPDPQYLAPSFTCEQVPSEENGFQGYNVQGWCNEEASELLHRADRTVDEDERAELVRDALAVMASDPPFVPLYQFPKSGAWRTDRLGGPVDGDLNNYMAFQNLWAWEDLDGDGTIVIGAAGYPGCLNPITECAGSAWHAWLVAFKVQPNFWDFTNDGEYVVSEIVEGEPVVELL